MVTCWYWESNQQTPSYKGIALSIIMKTRIPLTCLQCGIWLLQTIWFWTQDFSESRRFVSCQQLSRSRLKHWTMSDLSGSGVCVLSEMTSVLMSAWAELKSLAEKLLISFLTRFCLAVIQHYFLWRVNWDETHLMKWRQELIIAAVFVWICFASVGIKNLIIIQGTGRFDRICRWKYKENKHLVVSYYFVIAAAWSLWRHSKPGVLLKDFLSAWTDTF